MRHVPFLLAILWLILTFNSCGEPVANSLENPAPENTPEKSETPTEISTPRIKRETTTPAKTQVKKEKDTLALLKPKSA